MAQQEHLGRRPGQQAEQVEHRGRIGGREVVDPAVERRVAHLDGDEQHFVEREKDRDLDDDRQTAGDRVDLLLLVELHHRLLLLHLVIGEALADRHHLRLHRLHFRHRGVGFVGEREEEELDDDRDDQDGEAEISDVAIDPVHRQKQRLGDEVEPAPVDEPVELVEAQPVVIPVDNRYLLGAGEQPSIDGGGAARRDGLRRAEIVALISLDVVADGAGRKFRVDLGAGVGEKRRGPIFIGDAEPHIRCGE